MNKFILWDLDGTIVESEDAVFKSKMFKSASLKYKLEFDLEPKEFIGREARQIYKDLLVKNNISGLREEGYWETYNDWYETAVSFIKENVKDIKPRKNIIEVWTQTSELGIKHAVVTSSREDVARTYLESIGLLNSCELLTCINHVSKPKPDPEPYKLTLQKLRISAADCIVIEDSRSGIKSASDAGLYTIAWVNDILDPQYSIASLKLKDLKTEQLIDIFATGKNVVPTLQ
jgi:beta-phosphoglucomutase-like phosphatase (HAD superfamily)